MSKWSSVLLEQNWSVTHCLSGLSFLKVSTSKDRAVKKCNAVSIKLLTEGPFGPHDEWSFPAFNGIDGKDMT